MTTYATMTATIKINDEEQLIVAAREQFREDCLNDVDEEDLENQVPDVRSALAYLIKTGAVNPEHEFVYLGAEVEDESWDVYDR